jgi:hypothetical protein
MVSGRQAPSAAGHIQPLRPRDAHTRPLDLTTGKIYCRIRKRKWWRGFLSLLKTRVPAGPGEKLVLVLDDFSPHKHTEVRTWAADNDAGWSSCRPTAPG